MARYLPLITHRQSGLKIDNKNYMAEETLFATLCKVDTLYEAWEIVRSKNSSGGIDGMTVAQFEDNLERRLMELSEELKSGKWMPEPYMSIEIPKDGDESRRLGLLTVKDKVVQSAIKMLTEPLFERIFVSNSYGYRPSRGHARAVKRALHECMLKGNSWVLRLDIDNYFDTISHERLAKMLAGFINDTEIVRLMMLCVKMGSVNKRRQWVSSMAGVPQGATLSPVLSNFYLHQFDKYALTLSKSYVRYADDFFLMCATKEEAEDIYGKVSTFLRSNLELSLNEPVIKELAEGFEFLGIKISKDGLTLTDEKHRELSERIETITLTAAGMSEESKQSWNGIKIYYGALLPQDVLRPLDVLLYNHIRDTISKQYRDIPSKAALRGMVADVEYLTNEFRLFKKRIQNEYVQVYDQCKKKDKQKEAVQENRKIIEKRKAEYRKRESEGRELLVSSYGCVLGISQGKVVVKREGKVVAKQTVDALSHITIAGKGISVSSNLIYHCMKNKIPIDFFGYGGEHVGSMLSNKYIETTLWNKQAQCPLSKQMRLASAIIEAKLRNQFSLIKYFHKYHKLNNERLIDKYADFSVFFDRLKGYLKMEPEDNADFLTKLLGYESQGALKYWAYIRELLSDDEVGFEKRERHGAKDLVNCMLNYGYAILYARVWQALLAAKLNPYDSIIHVIQPGKPTFVYDVVEMFRSQVVDRVVLSLVQTGQDLTIHKGLLDDESRKLLGENILERLNRYEKYRGTELTMEQIIRRQAMEIAGYIDKDEQYKPYVAKW